MAGKKLNASYTLRLDQLFNDNGWDIDDNKDLKLSLYKKYIDRLQRLPDSSSRDLFLELSSRFDRIELKEVVTLFYQAYNTIDESLLKKAKTIYILPLVEPELFLSKNSKKSSKNNWYSTSLPKTIVSLFEKKKVDRPNRKSGEFIVSLFELSEYRELKYSEKFVFPKSYGNFKKIFKKSNDLLILADDFIGTGETADRVLKEFFKGNWFKSSRFDETNTVTLSLISQKTGVAHLKKTRKVKTFQALIRERGISDFYTTKAEISLNINNMILMENSLKCALELSLGYKKSEALVSILNKCPNNTFPVFWHETRNIPAPFPRRKIFNK